MKRFTLSALIIAAVLRLPAQQVVTPETPVAHVGAQTITAGEFVSRYELTPGFQRGVRGKTEEKKAEFLFTLIAEKLLAQQGREEGLDRDTALLNAVRTIERLFVRDELYRREVREKVKITEQELQRAMARAQEERKVYFLYAPLKTTADSLYRLIRAGRALESLRPSAAPNASWEGPDSAMTRWGEADERMEAAVYALKPGETCAPILLDDGYYIPKLVAKNITFSPGERERRTLRERVGETLRKRREATRMAEYIASALKDVRTNVRARVSKSVITSLFDAYTAATPADARRSDTAKFILTQDMVRSVLGKLHADARAPYVVFAHTEWTLETTLQKMLTSGLVIDRPTLALVRYGYEQRLRDIIDQENLTQKGYDLQLQRSSAVQQELGPWRDWYLAQLYKQSMGDTLTASGEELEYVKHRMMSDTLSKSDTAKAREAVIGMKLRALTDKNLGRLADKFGITVYEKNLSKVSVSTVPAMVYRYLGFGGRMFAVPLTEPNVQWLKFWERKNIRLP